MEGARRVYLHRVALESPHTKNKIKAVQGLAEKTRTPFTHIRHRWDARIFKGVKLVTIAGLGLTLLTMYRMASGEMSKSII
uniref:Uncharacterized protein n=1 Tax=Amphimedon queenslandica TaxID=400682 RepID=A0A1X7VP84_AMPQE